MEDEIIGELCHALILIESKVEAMNFLKDLCTPQEIVSLSERWRVCRLLAEENLSYRKIHEITGASLTTIGRVARFLKDERYAGYKTILERIK